MSRKVLIVPDIACRTGASADLSNSRAGPPVERFNEQSFFDFNAVNSISSSLGNTVKGAVVFNGVNGVRAGLYNPQKTDFSPRIGLAYKALSKLVVRAGFGTFFVPSYLGGGSTQGYGQATPWVAVQSNALRRKAR